MRRHVERELVRARTGAYAANAATNVAVIAKRVVRVMERTPDGKRMAWSVDIPPGLIARIDSEDLTEALGNLTENAARHARSKVEVAASLENGFTVLTVTDDGPGIPAERANDVLRRGVRLDQSGSAGLGLGIVSDIAEAWGGTLALDPTEHGCAMRLRIPVGRLPQPGAT
jgi:signal transduction histidine kinase